ncbi:uncharacterized protein LJ264_011489 isoform 1-T1 [Porphyrio hochstetteri]
MSGSGTALRAYNEELREGLAELRARREELSGRIREEEAERRRLQRRIWELTEQLAGTNESLARLLVTRSEMDKTIAETEAAYGKWQDSSSIHGQDGKIPLTCSTSVSSTHLPLSLNTWGFPQVQRNINQLWDYNPTITFHYACPPC